MNQLQIIEHESQRVLTTTQLAESFGTDSKIISRNFQRNADRYKQGKHYFSLSGEELQRFKGSRQYDGSLKYASVLYLWTEKGAWLHAKSLNNNQAWEAYEKLIDEYYDVIRQDKPISPAELALLQAQNIYNLEQRVESQETKIALIENKVDNQITLSYGEQRRLQKAVAIKVYELCDDKEKRPTLFRELYREIKDRFGVASYKDVKRKDLQSAINYIENWVPRRVAV